MLESLNGTTRSVPATPLGISNNPQHLMKTPSTPLTDTLGSRMGSHQLGDGTVNSGDLQPSLTRLTPTAQYENGPLSFNSSQGSLEESMQVRDLFRILACVLMVRYIAVWCGLRVWPQRRDGQRPV